MNKSIKINLLLYLSFFFCILLDSFSFSYQINNIKPSFVLLSFIYWNLATPEKMNVGHAFLLGLICDFMEGTFLGIYPLIFLFISYICQHYFHQIRPMKFLQQSVIIFLLVISVRFFLSLDFTNSEPDNLTLMDSNLIWLAFLNALISAIFWPIVFILLRLFRRKWITI